MNRARALAALASVAALPHAAAAQTITTLKAAGVPEESATPVLWGIRSGMFKRAGLDVDLSPQTSGAAIAAGVVGGSYEIGKSSIVPIIIAVSKQIPFKLVAAGGVYQSAHPNITLVALKTSPVRRAADLNGKVVGVSSPDDLYSLGIKAWMDKNGGNAASLKFIAIPQSETEAALEAGRIDAGATGTPQLQEELDSGKIRVVANMCDAIAPEFMFSVWFTSEATLARDRAAIATFAKTEQQAARYVNGHHAETVAALAAFTNVDPSIVARMTRAQMGTSLDPRLIQPVIDVCARYKVIPAGFDAATMIASGLT